ncbi:hypothetical protein FKP32DRAFT_1679355 [Trametes sanguinea]|nr:hypothetical protein FKP32DRAFT_1679355 [Trametes sanguinea]
MFLFLFLSPPPPALLDTESAATRVAPAATGPPASHPPPPHTVLPHSGGASPGVHACALLEGSLQGKISMYDYYTSLERMTDNTETAKAVDRYRAFMRIVAQWLHLMMLQRTSRGHDHAAHSPESLQFDVRRARTRISTYPISGNLCPTTSSFYKNPILGSSWCYFLEDTGYKEVLRGYEKQDEISSCTGFSALDHAESKDSRGYTATGVGAAVCARPELWLAQGVGDLQKGERYVNMDYIFVHAMQDYLTVNKLIPIPKGSIQYSIPKLHFRSRIQAGHSPYSLNFIPGAGRTNGEVIERRWWVIQPIAASTKVMGPGQRQGIQEDHWGYANWLLTMRDRLKAALSAHAEHSALFIDFTKPLRAENVCKWTAQIEAWEADPWVHEDPYIATSKAQSSG